MTTTNIAPHPILVNNAGEAYPTPAGGSSYDHPILVLDPDTKRYSIVYLGCQIGPEIDIVGEREKIRAAAEARAVGESSGDTGGEK